MTRNYRILYSQGVMRVDVGNEHTLKIVLVDSVGSLVLTNVVAGRMYVFLFQQNETTPVTIFNCPQMLNPAAINLQRGSVSVQSFMGLQTGQLASSMVSSFCKPL